MAAFFCVLAGGTDILDRKKEKLRAERAEFEKITIEIGSAMLYASLAACPRLKQKNEILWDLPAADKI